MRCGKLRRACATASDATDDIQIGRCNASCVLGLYHYSMVFGGDPVTSAIMLLRNGKSSTATNKKGTQKAASGSHATVPCSYPFGGQP
jgi:hypothetical protein